MWREYYMFVIAVLYVAGNLTANHLSYNIAPAAIALGSIVVMIPALVSRRALPAVFFCLGAMGSAFHCLRIETGSDPILHEGMSGEIEGIVSDMGLSSSGKPLLEVLLPGCKTIIYNMPENFHCLPGDTVRAWVKVSRVRNFTEDFDYVRYMAAQGIYHTCLHMPWKGEISCRPCTHVPVSLIPARFRWNFSSMVDRMMPGEEAAQTRAVVKALAYGYQDEIPEQVQESFRDSGAIHLLALSGMHLGLIYMFLVKVLAFIGNSVMARRLRSVIVLTVMWAYTLFTGSGVSILRAAVTFTIYELGAMAGRKKDGLSAMAASAILIATADPAAPSGLSFQLTYAAMTAIFLIFPHLRAIVNTRNKLAGNLADTCAMTVACQITTDPIILLHFGTFAYFSLLANLLCSPIVSLAMGLAPLSLVLSGLGDGPLTEAATWLLTFLLDLFVRINWVISQL